MQSFTYVIKDELGIHARPAGMLVKEAKKYESKIIMEHNGRTGDVSKLFALMSLEVKYNSNVSITVEGPDEELACNAIKCFMEENL